MPEQTRLEDYVDDTTTDDAPDDGNRCTAIADYSGDRCEREALPGVDVCSLHLHEADIAPDVTDDDATDDRARADGGQQR
jgi:hypothetical protein